MVPGDNDSYPIMAYIDYSPWGGDKPLIYFSADGKAVTVLNGSGGKERSWTVYKHFKMLLSKEEISDGGYEEQPEWAFVVTNGAEEVSLMRNSGENVLMVRSSSCSSWHNVSLVQAKKLACDLWAYSSAKIPEPIVRSAEFTPLGYAISYSAKQYAFSAVYDDDE